MAKVVGRDESAVKRSTCKSCASIVEYTLSEVRHGVHYDYAGGSDYVHYIKCPNCGREMYNVKYY